MLDFSTERTALVVVDMQNDFVRVGGAMEVPDTRKTIAPIQSLIAMARAKGMPVAYTKFVSGPKRTLLWNWSPQIPADNCCFRNFKRRYKDVEGEIECADVIEELYPQPEDYVFEKYGYSAFKNTPLIDILRANHCDSIIVVGTVTQICVNDTVHDAFHEGLNVLVASDGVSSFIDEQQKAVLENVAMKYGEVQTAAEIIKRLG